MGNPPGLGGRWGGWLRGEMGNRRPQEECQRHSPPGRLQDAPGSGGLSLGEPP